MNSLTPRISPRLIAGVCAGAIGALGVAAPAMAAPAPASTIKINDCQVQKSRATGVLWYSCGVSVQSTKNVSVHYKTNLATWKPKTTGPWRSQSGRLRFGGGGESLSLKFAVKNKKLTVKQVEKRVKVTLSNAHGATITDGVAKAAK